MRSQALLAIVFATAALACSGSTTNTPQGAGGTAGAAAGAGAGGTAGAAARAGAGAGTAGTGGSDRGSPPLSVLLFTKTAGFRHDSIPAARDALTAAGLTSAWTVAATEDASVFTDATLAALDVVVFLETTGDVLDDEQQGAFERFIGSGKGFVGVHSASDTEYDWPFYGELVGAYFREHPAIQTATLHVEDATHPALAGVPEPWTRTDEWYAFRENPRTNVHVLLSLDEASYAPGSSAMGDHPITWWHEYGGGRAFYTALGHTPESYADPVFVGLLTHAITWAGARP